MSRESTRDGLVMSILTRARRLSQQERPSYLDLACQNDIPLRDEVAEALDWEDRMGGFLEQPVLVSSSIPGSLDAGHVLEHRFEILRVIGEGGMGTVYEAFDRKREQRVAIKTAKPGCQHFLSPELTNALRLRHRNICLVNEIHTAREETGDFDFLTMELLEGETLSLYLANHGRLPTKQAFNVARQLCAGVQEAHRNGVIHRDLKTSNIILCPDGASGFRAVITDFGLAGEVSSSGSPRGTPGYMAPEIWQGVPASDASDLYSLGLILHRLVNGEATHVGADVANPAMLVPQAYRKLVDQLISIDPRRRCQAFATCFEVLRETQPDQGRTRRRFLAAAGVTVIAGGFILDRQGTRAAVRAWVADTLHPIPKKRFVFLWMDSSADAPAQSLLRSLTEAIENDLVRAEAKDASLYVIEPAELRPPKVEAAALNIIHKSMGANLVLAASCVITGGMITASKITGSVAQVDLTIHEVPAGTALRNARVTGPLRDTNALRANVIAAAARLLNVQLEPSDRQPVSTESPQALRAFQAGKTEMGKRNDSGLEAAISNFAAAADADAGFALAFAELARAYCRLYAVRGGANILELARVNAARAVTLDKDLPDAHTALAFVHQSKGDRDLALGEISRALILDPANPKILVWQAQIYTRFRMWDKADEAYLRLHRERPNYWLPCQERGVLLNLLGRNQEALGEFKTATILAPWSGLAFSNLGVVFLKCGDVKSALRSFRKSLEINAKDDGACLGYAQALLADGQFREALSNCLHAVALNPEEDQNWLGLADCYGAIHAPAGQAQSCYERAAREAERALRTDPSDGAAWMRMALYRVKLHPWEPQRSMIEQAIALGANDADSQIMRARVLLAGGDRRGALLILPGWLTSATAAFQAAFVPELRDVQGAAARPDRNV